MFVYVDTTDIPVEIRCSECDMCMGIVEIVEYNDTMCITVEPCKECEEE